MLNVVMLTVVALSVVAPMQDFKDATAYFGTAVSYMR